MAVFLLQGRPAGIPKQSKRSELRGEKRPGKDRALTGVFRLTLLKIQCESQFFSFLKEFCVLLGLVFTGVGVLTGVGGITGAGLLPGLGCLPGLGSLPGLECLPGLSIYRGS